MPMRPPVILDFDGSVGPMPGALVVPLSDWQERFRFGCGMGTYREFARHLDANLPADRGTVFFGSGDFHHASLALIARARAAEPFDVVVLDNHPDNMRYAFGVHCGSWVRRVAALPSVAHVHVVGITSKDVAWMHAWENYLAPLLRGKLTNWCVGVDVGWARRFGLADRFLAFDSTAALLDRFAESRRGNPAKVYLSIDKDVLGIESIRTNWDQGCMTEAQMLQAIGLFAGRLVGSDVTGEISAYRYRSAFKRWLAAVDGQVETGGARMAAWQRRQRDLNARLLEALRACD